MSLVGFKARNHPQQAAKPQVDDRATAPEVFAPLHERFRFTVDVAAQQHNAKLERYFTRREDCKICDGSGIASRGSELAECHFCDGLLQSWAGERVWCNPPYSNIEPWVAKAWESGAELVVMLLPANRTEQGWWQRHIERRRDMPGGVRVEFLKGRMRFINAGSDRVGMNERPPFGVCLAIWGWQAEMLRPCSSPSTRKA